MQGRSLKVAFARGDVTPESPCRMGGYNRAGLSEGVLDPIQINVVAVQIDGVPFLLIVLDSIMVSEEFALQVQARVGGSCGIPMAHIVTCAIHTHSAPAFFKLAFEDVAAENGLTGGLLERAVTLASQAWHNMRPAACEMERMEVEGLYGNRNVHDGPADKTCTVMTFTEPDGTVMGKLLNISVHPTILDGSNRTLSADLIGQTRMRLEDAWGCPVVCTNGTCGDVSTRFYRQGSGVSELMRTAEELALQIEGRLAPVPLNGGAPVSGEIRMPTVYDAWKDEDCERALKEAEFDSSKPWIAFIVERIALKRRLSPIKMTLISRYMVVGNLVVITMPCDTCSALGLEIKRAFEDREVVIIGYANAYCNYLVPQEDYGKYFETMNARTARGQADCFVRRVIDAVRTALTA